MLSGKATSSNDKLPPCPICRKSPSETYKPFCSKRCADVDLHRWLGGVYAVPAEDLDQQDADDDA